jgi:hypothetical protein
MNNGIRTCANYPWVFESPQDTACADAAHISPPGKQNGRGCILLASPSATRRRPYCVVTPLALLQGIF